MNCKLVLLLLGALCTIGCVRADKITLEDAKEAIKVAWKLYHTSNLNNDVYDQLITMSNGKKVKVKCMFAGDYGTRFDCGLPLGHQMPDHEYKDLKEWFEKFSYGTVLPPQKKKKYHNVMVNAICGDFNFHVEVVEVWVKKKPLSHLFFQRRERARE